MAATPPPLPGSSQSNADATPRAWSTLHMGRDSSTPPPLPGHGSVSVTRAAEALAAEKLRQARARMLLNEAELERFKNLIVFARTTVESRFQGRHKSRDLGGGGEFAEYLAYEPGRPVQAIDWHVFGRSRKLVIRRYRQESDMDVHLLVDASGSMAYTGGKREVKGSRASRVAAALAYLAIKQGDKVSLTLFANEVLEHRAAGGTRRHLMNLLRSLVKPAHEAAGRTDIPTSIQECDRLLQRRGRLVIISDFLGHAPDTIFDALAPFQHRGFEILMLQLTDPDELTLPDAPLARFVDMETGESIEVEPSEIRGDYEKRMRARTSELAASASTRRIDFAAFDTESPYREAIEAYLGFRRTSI